jgi:hypothetical protein
MHAIETGQRDHPDGRADDGRLDEFSSAGNR